MWLNRAIPYTSHKISSATLTQTTSIRAVIRSAQYDCRRCMCSYGTTLGLREVSEHIPYARRADILPAVMAPDDVVRFLKAVPDLKMRMLFIAIYAAGLRVSEAVKLTARDIDSKRLSDRTALTR